MKFLNLVSISSLIAATSAYKVLTPTTNSTIVKGKSVDVTWTSVDTDALDFSIYLVNFQDWPPTVLSLAQNVPQSTGSLDVHIPCDVASDSGWQLNFINGTNTYVIYAQSPKFSLTGSCVDPTTSSSFPVATTTSILTLNNTLTATTTATTTATVSQVVSTIVYESPTVWFVQPTTTGAMCLPGPEKTVTVYASGPAPSGGVGSGVPAGPSSGSGSGGYGNHSSFVAPPPSSTGAVIPITSSTSTPTFTGGASSVKVGGILSGLFVGAVAFLL